MKHQRNFAKSLVGKARTIFEVILATTLIASRSNYSVGMNPSQTFLQPVLSESGALINNWQSEIQPQSFWFLTEIFALIPVNMLTKFTLFFWLIQILIVVICFQLILKRYRVNLSLRLAGYILISVSSLSGIGATSGIIEVFYPTNLAFSMVCVLITCIIFQKKAAVGMSAGLVTLCNPSTGLLVLIVFIIPILITKLRSHEKISSTLIPLVLLSSLPIYFAIIRNLQTLNISNQERMNLRLISRMPHHYSYLEFPIYEYVSFVLWCIFLLVAKRFVDNSYQKTILHSAVLILVILMSASGFASIFRIWFFLIELRPIRLSPVVPFLGILMLMILSQILLSKVSIQIFSILISLFGLLEFIVSRELLSGAAVLTKTLPSPVLFEIITLISFASFCVLPREKSKYYSFNNIIQVIPVGMFTILNSMSLLAVSQSFNKPRSSIDMMEIYSEINSKTMPGDILMVPPALDSFPYFTKRAVIVEWAPNPFGKGEDEYIQRLIDVVGSPEMFNLDKPLNIKTIEAEMLLTYEKNLDYSLKVLCKYHAKYVFSTKPNFSNSFLTPIFSNSSGTILKVNSACIS